MKTAIFPVNLVLSTVVALLSVLPSSLEGFLGPQTLVLPRSQSVNAARDLVGWQQQLHRPSDGNNYWVFAFTPEYTHTFDSRHITEQLFGTCHFNVTGSAVPNRKSYDLLADYFALPRDFESELCVHPFISQFIADFNFYVGLDRICDGLFFLIHFPVVHTKWDIQFGEKIWVPGTAFDPAGYFSAERIERKNLLRNMREYLLGTRPVGDMEEPLAYQKVFGLTGRDEANRLAEVQFALGYDFARSDAYHFGIEARAYAPAGNRPNALYLFDAIVGNGHHWELGAGLTSHYRIWDDGCHAILVYLDANITHLFSAGSKRAFNLKNRCRGSRYMLLEEIAPGSLNLFADGEPATDQYVGRLLPAVNVTTACVDTYFNVQADIALKLAFCRNNFCFDLGYNFWGRSHEKIDCPPFLPPNRYALKGDAQVYGFSGQSSYYGYSSYLDAIPLSATQNEATIFAGQGAGNFVPGMEFANENADNKAYAFGPISGDILVQLDDGDSAALYIPQEPVYTSQPSIFLTDDDIDVESGLVPTSITNKMFMHFGYTWYSTVCNPFLGAGCEIEWADGYRHRGGIAQWGIWWKLGLAY